MIIHMLLFLSIFFCTCQSLQAMPLADQLAHTGFIELPNQNHPTETFYSLYRQFDKLIAFLESNPSWAQKLYIAKERFIRSKDRHLYSSDFFGFYDESIRPGRNQLSFYYSIHFHEFLCSHYPEFQQIPEIIRFLDSCYEIQTPCELLFNDAAANLGLTAIFSANDDHPPTLLKVVKYLPSYTPSRPHYDGTAFSLFLHSTDHLSLLISPYKLSLTPDDFSPALRSSPNSILLIPGALLTEFSIYPTPHIVVQRGNSRYATVAFAMRPYYIAQKTELAPLPNFSTIE